MKYKKIVEAVFVDRPNRFIAHVLIDGRPETVHVKNTGRCRELLYEGVRVILFDSENPSRKTRYDLVAVWKENFGLINIDSQAPNQVVKEWLSDNNEKFPGITYLKPECKYGDSRFDFYFEQGEVKTFLEVKGCTLEVDGIGYFPDAPTERGVKHIHELIKAKEQGYNAYLAYVIAMPGIRQVRPNIAMQPEYGKACEAALSAGVKILFLQCQVTADGLDVVACEEYDG